MKQKSCINMLPHYKVGDTSENWIAGLDAIFHNFLLFIRLCDLISHTSNYCPLKVLLNDRFWQTRQNILWLRSDASSAGLSVADFFQLYSIIFVLFLSNFFFFFLNSMNPQFVNAEKKFQNDCFVCLILNTSLLNFDHAIKQRADKEQ